MADGRVVTTISTDLGIPAPQLFSAVTLSLPDVAVGEKSTVILFPVPDIITPVPIVSVQLYEVAIGS